MGKVIALVAMIPLVMHGTAMVGQTFSEFIRFAFELGGPSLTLFQGWMVATIPIAAVFSDMDSDSDGKVIGGAVRCALVYLLALLFWIATP